MSQLHFELSSFTVNNREVKLPVGGYDYWVPLMESFLHGCDAIEIHCWHEEHKTIQEIIASLQSVTVDARELMIVFKGELTDQGAHYFTSEHYGTEFHAFQVDDKEISFIKSVMPEDLTLQEIK